jgi:hypothetical protein
VAREKLVNANLRGTVLGDYSARIAERSHGPQSDRQRRPTPGYLQETSDHESVRGLFLDLTKNRQPVVAAAPKTIAFNVRLRMPRARNGPLAVSAFGHVRARGCIDRGELARLFRRSLPFVSGHFLGSVQLRGQSAEVSPPTFRGESASCWKVVPPTRQRRAFFVYRSRCCHRSRRNARQKNKPLANTNVVL